MNNNNNRNFNLNDVHFLAMDVLMKDNFNDDMSLFTTDIRGVLTDNFGPDLTLIVFGNDGIIGFRNKRDIIGDDPMMDIDLLDCTFGDGDFPTDALIDRVAKCITDILTDAGIHPTKGK